ncbi:MAG: diaminopimelate epimerase [Clostridia bacterium]|nr:diaminopimelate epimerase [Clostridia bacterium]
MRFVKMHAAGNDYIYFEQGSFSDEELSRLAVEMSDRHKGIGSDGIICLKKRGDGVTMRIFNADGSEGMTCGNGVRCAAAFALKYMGVKGNPLPVYTRTGARKVLIEKSGQNLVCTADMGVPTLSSTSEYFCEKLQSTDLFVNIRDIFAVNVGNEHAVFFSGLPLSVAAEHANGCGLFGGGVNVECVKNYKDGLFVEVCERGSGKTLSCGSGAVAAVYAATVSGRAKEGEFISVYFSGGKLEVKILNGRAYLKSEVCEVFTGDYEV